MSEQAMRAVAVDSAADATVPYKPPSHTTLSLPTPPPPSVRYVAHVLSELGAWLVWPTAKPHHSPHPSIATGEEGG